MSSISPFTAVGGPPPGDVLMLIRQGGFVMVPLIVLSVIALALVLERCWFWITTNSAATGAWLSQLGRALREGDRAASRKLIESARPTVYARVAARLLRDGASDAVALEAVERARPKMERFMVMLSTIITAAPLLGILGTVIGIIQSFRILGASTTAQIMTDPSDVAGGIAQALLTTALGLIIAIATLFPYMAFRKQVDRGLSRIETLIAAMQHGAATSGSSKPSAGESQQPPAARTAPAAAAGLAGHNN